MRIIAIIKKCLDCEKELILSSVEKEDKVLFFDNETELLKSEDYANIEIVFGEPEHSTIQSMKNLRWIQMSWAGANKYTSALDFPNNIVLTSASGAYGYVISEYIVSGLLALYRKLFLYRMQIESGGWNQIEGDDTLEGKRGLSWELEILERKLPKNLNVLGLIRLECVVHLERNMRLLMKYIP